MATIEDLKSWIERDITRFSPSENHTQEKTLENGTRFLIFTNENRYSLYAKDGHLGCQGRSRKPRAGEDWSRGNDLADGPLSEETWRKILGDIISYEMVKIHNDHMHPSQVYVDPKQIGE